MPQNSSTLRYEHTFPYRLSRQDLSDLDAIHAWAERTDPGSMIRDKTMRDRWLEGQKSPVQQISENLVCLL